MKIPQWVSARGVTIDLPFRKKLYIVLGGHSAFKPGKKVLFERCERFRREVVVAVKNLEKFIESVERGTVNFYLRFFQ
ncbi:MAG: hypothetical protein QXF26_05170 [Candidatus Bathyarchaeia archaeon]